VPGGPGHDVAAAAEKSAEPFFFAGQNVRDRFADGRFFSDEEFHLFASNPGL
jgi:hypothetical protein